MVVLTDTEGGTCHCHNHVPINQSICSHTAVRLTRRSTPFPRQNYYANAVIYTTGSWQTRNRLTLWSLYCHTNPPPPTPTLTLHPILTLSLTILSFVRFKNCVRRYTLFPETICKPDKYHVKLFALIVSVRVS